MPDVAVTRTGRVAVLTLDRPSRGNSVGGTLFADLLELLEQADADDTVGAVVTAGAGRTYCVGADAAELDALLDQGPIELGDLGIDGIGGSKGLPPLSGSQIRADHLGIGRWVQHFLDVGTPTVAAVNGPAAGGGFALTLLHDVRIASTRARFLAAMPNLGLAPEMGMSWLLPRLIGAGRAFDVMTRTTAIDADEALALGLVTEVVEPDELIAAAVARADALAALPTQGARTVKRLLRAAWSSSIDEQLEREWLAQRLLFSDTDTGAALRRMIELRRRAQSDTR